MKIYKKIIFFTIFFILSFNEPHCIISPEYIINNYKFLTPGLEADIYAKPVRFSKTNNLTQKVGSPFVGKGKIIKIKGYILDLIGSPVDNAKINIWQTNTFGYYNYLVDKTDYSKYDEDFESTGTFITDNTGYFYFITIIPGIYGERAPHIHLKVNHKRFPTLETEIFLQNHPKNSQDKKFSSIKETMQKLLICNFKNTEENQIPTCIFNIRLNGIDTKKKY